MDVDGNAIEAFRQLINNSSTAPARDNKAPIVDAGVTSTQGNVIALHFDEHLAQPRNDGEFVANLTLISISMAHMSSADIAAVSIKSQDITSVNYETANNIVNVEIQDGLDQQSS